VHDRALNFDASHLARETIQPRRRTSFDSGRRIEAATDEHRFTQIDFLLICADLCLSMATISPGQVALAR